MANVAQHAPPRTAARLCRSAADGRGLDARRPRHGAALGQFGGRPALPAGRPRRGGACAGSVPRSSPRWPPRSPTISSSPRPTSPSASTTRTTSSRSSCCSRSLWSPASSPHRIRRQARIAEGPCGAQRDHRRPCAAAADLHDRAGYCRQSALRELARLFDCNAVLVGGRPEPRSASQRAGPMQLTPSDIAVAALVLDSGERAGRGVDRAVPTEWQFHPVRSGSSGPRGHGPRARRRRAARPRDQLPLLDNLLDQVALALERGRLEGEAREFAARPRTRPGSLGACSRRSARISRRRSKAIADAVGALRRGGIGRQGAGRHVGVGSRRSSSAISPTCSTSARTRPASPSRSAA